MTDEEYVKLAHPDADIHGQQNGVHSEYRVKLTGQWPTQYLTLSRFWAKSYAEAWSDARERLMSVAPEAHASLRKLPGADKLLALRSGSERGLVPMTVIIVGDKSLYRVLVVLRNPEPREVSQYPDTNVYHCHRYWRVGGSWELSLDEQRCSQERAWQWLAESNVKPD
jgi:hypothetical protein